MITPIGAPCKGGSDAGLWQILDAAGLPDVGGYCEGGGRPALLRSRGSPLRGKVIRPSCRSWRCRVCGPRMRRAAGVHYGRKILAADGYLFHEPIEPGDWGRHTKELSRCGASWVRVGGRPRGGVAVGSRPSDYGKPITDAGAAVRVLCEALRGLEGADVGRCCHPVASSRDWKPDGPPPPQNLLVGHLTTRNPLAVRAALAAVGIEATVRLGTTDAATWLVLYSAPPGQEHLAESALAPWLGHKP